MIEEGFLQLFAQKAVKKIYQLANQCIGVVDLNAHLEVFDGIPLLLNLA